MAIEPSQLQRLRGYSALGAQRSIHAHNRVGGPHKHLTHGRNLVSHRSQFTEHKTVNAYLGGFAGTSTYMQ